MAHWEHVTGFSEVNRVSNDAGPAKFFNDVHERLLPLSRNALSMASAILNQPGMSGWMMVYLPPDDKAPCEVMTTTNAWTLSMTPESFTPGRKR